MLKRIIIYKYIQLNLLYVSNIQVSNEQGQYLNFVRLWQIVFFFFSSTFRAFLCSWRFRLLLLQRNGCRIYKLRKSELLLLLVVFLLRSFFTPLRHSLSPYISLNALNRYWPVKWRFFFFFAHSIFVTNYSEHACQMFTDFMLPIPISEKNTLYVYCRKIVTTPFSFFIKIQKCLCMPNPEKIHKRR